MLLGDLGTVILDALFSIAVLAPVVTGAASLLWLSVKVARGGSIGLIPGLFVAAAAAYVLAFVGFGAEGGFDADDSVFGGLVFVVWLSWVCLVGAAIARWVSHRKGAA